jgi:hypothetical protein
LKALDFVQSQLTVDKSYNTYLTSIRGAIRALYREQLSLFEFVDNMVSIIERNLIIAWNNGAADCGIRPNEFSQAELLVRDRYISDQFRYILGLGQSVQADRNVVRIGESLRRAEMWANRWRDIRALGSQTVCADIKMLWQWAPEKEHCVDCQAMNGRVYRNSTWNRYGIRPGSANLACFGGHCGCELVPTDLPITPGRPPALKGPGG